MHAYILMVVLFLAPVNGQPEQVKAASFLAPDASSCEALAQVVWEQYHTDARVNDIEVSCTDVKNAKDVAS